MAGCGRSSGGPEQHGLAGILNAYGILQIGQCSMPAVEKPLRRYPSRVCELVLGTSRPIEVARAAKEFAATYDDTAHMIDRVSGIVNVVLSSELPSEFAKHRRRFERHLEELAFEAHGASTNWYVAHGAFCGAAVFLWVARLCCCVSTKFSGFSASIEGLSEYALFGSRHREEMTLLLEMCEQLLPTLDWDDTLHLLVLYCCVGVLTHNARNVEHNVFRKLEQTPVFSTLEAALDLWWEPSAQDLSSLGATYFDIDPSGPPAYRKPGRTAPEELRQARELFTRIARGLALELAKKNAPRKDSRESESQQ